MIAKRYGAANLAVFGSVARDEATDSSDIDLLVDLLPGPSLLRHNVDLICRRNLKPELDGLADVQKRFIAAVALGMTAGQIKATQ